MRKKKRKCTKKPSGGEGFAILPGVIIGWGSFLLPGTKFPHTSGVINASIGIFLGIRRIVLIERSCRCMMQQDSNGGGVRFGGGVGQRPKKAPERGKALRGNE